MSLERQENGKRNPLRIFLVAKGTMARVMRTRFKAEGHEIALEAEDLNEALEMVKRKVGEGKVSVMVVDPFCGTGIFQGGELIETSRKNYPKMGIISFSDDPPPQEFWLACTPVPQDWEKLSQALRDAAVATAKKQ